MGFIGAQCVFDDSHKFLLGMQSAKCFLPLSDGLIDASLMMGSLGCDLSMHSKWMLLFCQALILAGDGIIVIGIMFGPCV